MFSTLRNRFGIPGVISVFALVFAMIGGAYAASDGGSNDGATASAKKKAAKGPKGAKGATGAKGAKGATGAAGPAGPAGPAGSVGAKGDAGAKGDTGANGDSVTGTPIAAGGACGAGVTGVKYTLDGSSTDVCNGKNGTNGKNGEFDFGTLPGEATLTGTWALGPLGVGAFSSGLKAWYTSISFPVPLEQGLAGSGCELNEAETGIKGPCDVHYINPAGKEYFLNGSFELKELNPTDCGSGIGPGVNAENPQANPGHLCVYAARAVNITDSGFFPFPKFVKPGASTTDLEPSSAGASTAGSVLFFTDLKADAEARGTWAVTAE